MSTVKSDKGIADRSMGFGLKALNRLAGSTLLDRMTDGRNERADDAFESAQLQTILRDQGASAEDIRSLVAVLGARGRDGGLREGQKLRIMFAPDGGRLRVVRVIVVGDSAVEAVVALESARTRVHETMGLALSRRSRCPRYLRDSGQSCG